MGIVSVLKRPIVLMSACLCPFSVGLTACWPLPDNPAASSSQSQSINTGNTSFSNTGSSNARATVLTVTVKESQGASGDVYRFDPTSITVHGGDSITIVNQSDELQDIDQGDAAKAGIDVKVPVNQSATATFNTAGTFTLKNEKGATLTVTVN